MTALLRLSDEEAYLVALLLDSTGADLAEFLWEDTEDSFDGCYRLWAFQWPWTHTGAEYEIDAMARQTGKSFSVVWKAMAFAFQQPGQEMLITAPELNHLELLTSKIENAFTRYRLLDDMRPRNASRGIKRQPHWTLRLQNGATIMTRLPNRDGRGVKGTHPVVIELDEIQDYPLPGYTELIETIKTNASGVSWRVHGVSKGVGRDLHYVLTQGKNEGHRFRVHHYIAAHRPNWGPRERQIKIAQYGGDETHPDYQRNVLGLPADSGATLFVTARLLGCVRIRESKWATEYNDEVYTRLKISDALVNRVGAVEDLLDFNYIHLADTYKQYWAGADIGFTSDPTEILVFGSVKDVDRLLLRVRLERISAPNQARVVRAIFDFFGARLKRFGMDRTGNGLPLWQYLKGDPVIAKRIIGYNFSENRPVEFDDREPVRGEKPEDLVILRNIKDYATDELRKLVDSKRLELPFDDEILKEWQGQTAYIVRTNPNDDGTRRKYGGGDCVPGDAQVLTDGGWVPFAEYVQNPVAVAQWTDGALEMVTPTAIVQKPFSGHLVQHVNADRFYSATTPEHLLPGVRRGKLTFRPAKDATFDKMHVWPRSGVLDGPGTGRTLDEIALELAVSADGCIQSDAKKSWITFGFQKQRKVDRLVALLTRMGINHRVTQASPTSLTYIRFYTVAKSATPGLAWLSKTLPTAWLTTATLAEREFILSELDHWDGYRGSAMKRSVFSTTIYDHAVWAQTMSHTAGRMATICHAPGQFQVTLQREKAGSYWGSLVREDIPFEGDVFCVEVPSGMFLVRQHEAISMIHNCHTLDAARMYAAAKSLMGIETLLEKNPYGPVLDRFF